MNMGWLTAHIRLASTPSNLRNEKIDTERGILVIQKALQLVDGALKKFGALSNATNDSNTACEIEIQIRESSTDSSATCIGNCCCKSRAGRYVHTKARWSVAKLEFRER